MTCVVAPFPLQISSLQSPGLSWMSVPMGAATSAHSSHPTHLERRHALGEGGQMASEMQPGPAHEPAPLQWHVPAQGVSSEAGTTEHTPPSHAAEAHGPGGAGQSAST